MPSNLVDFYRIAVMLGVLFGTIAGRLEVVFDIAAILWCGFRATPSLSCLIKAR